MRALASPASLKGVLSARDAAALLARGLRDADAEVEDLPVADGGEGTADVLGAEARGRVAVRDAFGRRREATLYDVHGAAVVEAADAVPLDPRRLDPLAASSRGVGELIDAARASRLIVCLGGTATMDGGAGMREVLDRLPVPTVALADTRVTLRDAPRVFGPQKGATPADVVTLERRLAAMPELAAFADLPGSGAAGGLGAALAALGADLVSGAEYVFRAIGFHDRAAHVDLVVSGEGVVDATTGAGKAPGAVLAACRELGVRCVVFGGRVETRLEGAEMAALSGDPARARDDLVELGRRLAGAA